MSITEHEFIIDRHLVGIKVNYNMDFANEVRNGFCQLKYFVYFSLIKSRTFLTKINCKLELHTKLVVLC